jgi:hypothetical protein
MFRLPTSRTWDARRDVGAQRGETALPRNAPQGADVLRMNRIALPSSTPSSPNLLLSTTGVKPVAYVVGEDAVDARKSATLRLSGEPSTRVS